MPLGESATDRGSLSSMINIPRFRGICELSREIPAAIGEFLNIELLTSRRVREETASDIVISAIAEIPGNNIVLILPR